MPMEGAPFHRFVASLFRYFILKNKKRPDLSERFSNFNFLSCNF